jgi:hypothetical protein
MGATSKEAEGGMKTLWCSFCDEDRPKGEQFLGVAIVEVDEDDVAMAAIVVAMRFPNALDGAEVIAAASRKAHEMGCNPGGQMLCAEVPPEMVSNLPKHALLRKAELHAAGHI